MYTRFLQEWEMDSESRQPNTIDRIVRTHGICPATEDQLFFRLASCESQHGLDHLESLGDLLDSHCGDFTTSPLFGRIVLQRYYMHAQEVKEHGKLASFCGVFCRAETNPLEVAAAQAIDQNGLTPHMRN